MDFRNHEVTTIVSLLNAGIITRGEARKLLGIEQESQSDAEEASQL